MNGPEPGEATVEQRHRTLLTLWSALCVSLLLYLLMIHFLPARPDHSAAP